MVLPKPFRNGFLLIHPNHLSDGMEPSTKQEETRLFTIARWFACLIKQQGNETKKSKQTLGKKHFSRQRHFCLGHPLFRCASWRGTKAPTRMLLEEQTLCLCGDAASCFLFLWKQTKQFSRLDPCPREEKGWRLKVGGVFARCCLERGKKGTKCCPLSF